MKSHELLQVRLVGLVPETGAFLGPLAEVGKRIETGGRRHRRYFAFRRLRRFEGCGTLFQLRIPLSKTPHVDGELIIADEDTYFGQTSVDDGQFVTGVKSGFNVGPEGSDGGGFGGGQLGLELV